MGTDIKECLMSCWKAYVRMSKHTFTRWILRWDGAYISHRGAAVQRPGFMTKPSLFGKSKAKGVVESYERCRHRPPAENGKPRSHSTLKW